MKLKEEEQRAVRYLETRKGCDSVTVVSYMYSIHVVLIDYFLLTFWGGLFSFVTKLQMYMYMYST